MSKPHGCLVRWDVAWLCLKGQCHEIFCVWFFSWISFPPAPEYPNRTVSNFFENSRRYSQLKSDHRCRWHRWQMKKIFNQKNFNNFVGPPMDSRVNIYINFCLQVHLKVSAAWYCSHYLPPVSLIPVANLPPVSLIPVAICHWCRWHRQQICRGYHWHRWSTFSCKYLREFSKKLGTALMVYSGAWRKLIHEKNQKQKISWHCPCKGPKIKVQVGKNPALLFFEIFR